MMESNESLFNPWIPENYGSGKFGKLLIIGESHYYDEDDQEDQKDEIEFDNYDSVVDEHSFTKDIITGYLDGSFNISFYRNIGLLFNPNDRFEIWREAAFVNLIQTALSSSKSQPSNEHIKLAKENFFPILDRLDPDKILVCSRRMWNNWLPDESPRGKYITPIEANGKKSTIWEYSLKNKICRAMGINHPSKYFSYNEWRPIVKSFLSDNYPIIK